MVRRLGLGGRPDQAPFRLTTGHAGAYSTNNFADTQRGLVLVWLVQHAGFPGEGNKSHDAFKRAAFEAFAAAKK